MRMLTIILAALWLAAPVFAVPLPSQQETFTYDWADGEVDYLGTFDQDMLAEINHDANRPGSPGFGLQVTKNLTAAESTVSMGFLAAVWGLQEGDEVTARLWRYDTTMNSPNGRLRAHYNNDLVAADDARSLPLALDHGLHVDRSGLGTFSGWEELSCTWVIEEGYTGLVIDIAVNGDLGAALWIDDLTIIAPEYAHVRMPNAYYYMGQGVRAESSTWSAVKHLFQ